MMIKLLPEEWWAAIDNTTLDDVALFSALIDYFKEQDQEELVARVLLNNKAPVNIAIGEGYFYQVVVFKRLGE